MKRFAALLMVTAYLCATTECYQLLKTPLLVMHFITHCQQDPNTSILGFIEEHYSGDFVMDDDWQQDMQLPFKSCVCAHASITTVMHADVYCIDAPTPTELQLSFTPKLPVWQSENPGCSIFQPPRLA